MSVTDELLRKNDAYARSFDKGSLPLPPAKHLAVLACMDARLDVHKILGLSEGDAHPMEDERIECRWFSSAEIDRMLRVGKIIDGKTMIGYLTWKRSARH